MQSKKEIEQWFENKDPWGYENNPEDIRRKEFILSLLKKKYKRALDIGCGEGWITKDLPARWIYGYEISDNAAKRFPKNVKREIDPTGEYDLILATGVMYKHYDYDRFLNIILNNASGTVLLSNIKEWEVDVSRLGTPVFQTEYPYREFTQSLKIYDYGSIA